MARRKRYRVKGKLGTGTRFKRLKRTLAARKGKRKVRSPGALAAWIGRKKYSKARLQKMAAKGRSRAAKRRRRRK